MNILWFLLPGILYLGIVTSYTDIRYGKIRNRDVLIGIFYALAVYLLLFVYFFIASGVNYMYFLELITNAIFALAVAFGLWYYKIWSAGDGKLFFAFALLVPPEAYLYGRYNWIPSLTLLFNLFIVGLFAMLFLLIKNARWQNYKKTFFSFFKDFFSPKMLLHSIVSLFAIFWLVHIILSFVGLGKSFLLMYFFTILVMSKLPALFSNFSSKKLKSKSKNLYMHFMTAIALLRFVVDKSVYSLTFLWEFLLLVFVWRAIRSLFRQGARSLGKDLFSYEVKVISLKPGMLLSETLIQSKRLGKKELKERLKRAQTQIKVFNKDKSSYFFGDRQAGKDYLNSESEGLTKGDIRKIKKIGFKKVKISSTVPFSPLIFFGVLATLLIKGNILILRHFLFS